MSNKPKKNKKPQLDFDFEAQIANDDILTNKKKNKNKKSLAAFELNNNDNDDDNDDDTINFIIQPKKSNSIPVINRANLLSLSNFDSTNHDDGDDEIPDTSFLFAPEHTIKPSPIAPTTTNNALTPTQNISETPEEVQLRLRHQAFLRRRHELAQTETVAAPSVPSSHGQISLPSKSHSVTTSAISRAAVAVEISQIPTPTQFNPTSITTAENISKTIASINAAAALGSDKARYLAYSSSEDEGGNDDLFFVKKSNRTRTNEILQESALTTQVGADEQLREQLQLVSNIAASAVKETIIREEKTRNDSNTLELPDDADTLEDVFIEVTLWREREAKRLLRDLEEKMKYLGISSHDDTTKEMNSDDDYYITRSDEDSEDDITAALTKRGINEAEYLRKKDERSKWKVFDKNARIRRRFKTKDGNNHPGGREMSEHEYYTKNKSLYERNRHDKNNNGDVVSFTTDDFARKQKKQTRDISSMYTTQNE